MPASDAKSKDAWESSSFRVMLSCLCHGFLSTPKLGDLATLKPAAEDCRFDIINSKVEYARRASASAEEIGIKI